MRPGPGFRPGLGSPDGGEGSAKRSGVIARCGRGAIAIPISRRRVRCWGPSFPHIAPQFMVLDTHRDAAIAQRGKFACRRISMSLDSDVIVDRRRIRRKLTFWRVLAVAIAIAAMAAIGMLATPTGRGAFTSSGSIARISIDG